MKPIIYDMYKNYVHIRRRLLCFEFPQQRHSQKLIQKVTSKSEYSIVAFVRKKGYSIFRNRLTNNIMKSIYTPKGLIHNLVSYSR